MSDLLPAVAEPIALLFKINNSMVTRGLEGLSAHGGTTEAALFRRDEMPCST